MGHTGHLKPTTTGAAPTAMSKRAKTHSTLRINAQRLEDDFHALAEIGATVAGGVSRLALSNEDLEARAWFANRLDEAGLVVGDDDAGNLSGTLFSSDPDAKQTLLIGSHLDSVPNGGRYDSSTGLIAGLEVLRTLHDAQITLPFHLEVINFTDVEGCWHSFFGSKSLTGVLSSKVLADIPANGHDAGAFRAALYRAGIHPADVFNAQRDAATLAGYIELHIEQGQRLYAADKRIGIVTGIVGRSTYELIFYGEAAHSGTTSSEDRRDALYGAVDFLMAAHAMVQAVPDAVFNCGHIAVEPGGFNVIPSTARLKVELRHPDGDVLSELESRLVRLAQERAAAHQLTVAAQRLVHIAAVQMSGQVIAAVQAAVKGMGIKRVMPLVSYAGHDAQLMSRVTPTGMIFVPSVRGISHNPREFTDWDDIVLGTNVLLQTVLRYAKAYRS